MNGKHLGWHRQSFWPEQMKNGVTFSEMGSSWDENKDNGTYLQYWIVVRVKSQ